MREVLLDIIRHTGGLGFLDTVKITGSDEETLIESMDNERTVILKAKLKTPNPEFNGTFGMSRFNILQGFLGFANYRTDEATLEILRKDRNGESIPEELVFTDESEQSSTYRFMSADLIPEQGKFIGVDWQVTIKPSISKMKEFIQMSSILGGIESYFLVKTVDKKLKFYIGDENATTDRSAQVIAENIEGDLKRDDLYWEIASTVAILKLGFNEDLTMQFTSKGALQISMATELAEYNYILPARKR